MIASIESNQLKRQCVRIGFANDSSIGRASDLINWLVSGSSPDHLLLLLEKWQRGRMPRTVNAVYHAMVRIHPSPPFFCKCSDNG